MDVIDGLQADCKPDMTELCTAAADLLFSTCAADCGVCARILCFSDDLSGALLTCLRGAPSLVQVTRNLLFAVTHTL